MPAACLDERQIARAIERAPAPVRLADGTPLSRCVSLGAASDADLQALGASLTRLADDLHLAARAEQGTAVRLGYLVGAVRRGAARTLGVAAQLARRLEQTASFDDALTRRTLQRGVAAGEATG